MGLWAVARANRKSTGKQNPIISILQKELDINPQQVRKILDQQKKIRDLSNNLHACLVLLQKLKDLCEQKNKIFSDRMNKTREILEPKQVAKLILFVKEHTDVFAELCPGWTSEQIVKAKKKRAKAGVANLAAVAAAVVNPSSAVHSSSDFKPPAPVTSSSPAADAASNQSIAQDAATQQADRVTSGSINKEDAMGDVQCPPEAAAPAAGLTSNESSTAVDSKEGGIGCTSVAGTSTKATKSEPRNTLNAAATTPSAGTTISIQPPKLVK